MMPNSVFHFQQFSVQQDQCAMKVGTDGVLLGAWAAVQQATRILDIGTGTGLIALMLAQRQPTARIDAIEIVAEAAKQATQNVARSPWASKVNVLHQALQGFIRKNQDKVYYDLIVTNPPYFQQSLKSANTARSQARHDLSLTFDDLLEAVQILLNPKGNGRFCVILPIEQQQIFQRKALMRRLYTQKILFIRPKPQLPPKRVLLQMQYKTMPNTLISKDLAILEESGQCYTNEYRKLTKFFYLNL